MVNRPTIKKLIIPRKAVKKVKILLGSLDKKILSTKLYLQRFISPDHIKQTGLIWQFRFNASLILRSVTKR